VRHACSLAPHWESNYGFWNENPDCEFDSITVHQAFIRHDWQPAKLAEMFIAKLLPRIVTLAGISWNNAYFFAARSPI
jgi:hypothetical protein